MKSIEQARLSASRHHGPGTQPKLPMQVLADLLRSVDPQFNHTRLADVLDIHRDAMLKSLTEFRGPHCPLVTEPARCGLHS